MKTRASRTEEVCPRRMKEDVRPDTDRTVFGTAVHAAFDLWRNPPFNDFTGEVADPYTLEDAWDDICCREYFEGSRPGEGKPNTMSMADMKEGLDSLTHWAKEVERTRPMVRMTEWSFTLVLGDHIVTGTVDAVDEENGILVVADYKTGHGDYDAYKSSQLSIYAIAVANHYKWTGKIRMEFRCVTKGYRRWRYTSLAELMAKDAPQIVNILNRLEAYEERDEWPEFLNKYCAYCSLRHDCETYQTMGLSPLNPETAVEQWSEAKLLESLAKKRAAELKPIALKGMEGAKSHKGVTRYSSSKRKVDIGRLIATVSLEDLFEYGVIKTASVTALDKLVEAKPELAQGVANCISGEMNENLKRQGKKSK